MLISALASDYDGTLASEGVVADETLVALRRLKASGRKLLLVTGRELPDLMRVFPQIGLFDLVVAENGALLYRPDGAEETPLAPHPPQAFVEALKARKVLPLALGRTIVATADENAPVVEDTLRTLGLDWRLILNKDSVMCLPPGVDKASGLAAALAALDLHAAEVLGVGDAENDATFIAACGVSAAVGNALPELKAVADIVTEAPAGAGVAWLIGRLLEDPQAFAQLAQQRQGSPLPQRGRGRADAERPAG
ncbi:MAG TPA: HAD family hydrolase [Caulobacteraceae bacterium]